METCPKVKPCKKASRTNSNQVREIVADALREYGEPLHLHTICKALNMVCKFKIRQEYLLMALLCKQAMSGIEYVGELKFGLAEWNRVH